MAACADTFLSICRLNDGILVLDLFSKFQFNLWYTLKRNINLFTYDFLYEIFIMFANLQ